MVLRKLVAWGAVGAMVAGATAPASAQFYLKSRVYAGDPVRGDEPGIGDPLPGATPAEVRASLVWSMRAGLNVAALQCQFEPTLLTVTNYNAILADHKAEFKGAFDTLAKYFLRVGKTKARGQTMLDQYGTRTYSSFVTVAGQFGFCQTAAAVGRDAVFRPRGQFGDLAALRMAELRASLTGQFGELAVTRVEARENPPLPRLDPVCWNKKGEWVERKCGAWAWPPA